MRKRDKERWIKALRSGKYEQVPDTLRGPTSTGGTGYCCLGVACEVFNVPKMDCGYLDLQDGRKCDQTDVLPRQLMEELDLEDPEGRFFDSKGLVDPDSPGLYYSLTELNDAGFSFKQLADFIEEYF